MTTSVSHNTGEVIGHVCEFTVFFVLCCCWDYSTFSLTDFNRYKLRLRHGFVPDLLLFTLRLAVARNSKTGAKARRQNYGVQYF